VYGEDDPIADPAPITPLRITNGSRGAILHLALPHVSRRDVELARTGDELVVTVGSHRRLLSLPASLSRHRVSAARVEQGELQVRFEEMTP
jgi:arsenite/tail-anchored protein-transporting ATPase